MRQPLEVLGLDGCQHLVQVATPLRSEMRYCQKVWIAAVDAAPYEQARPRLKARPARDHFLHPQAATVMGITIVLDGSLSTATASAYSAAVTVRSARSAGSSLSSVRRRKCVVGGVPPRTTGQRPSAAASTKPAAETSSRRRRPYSQSTGHVRSRWAIAARMTRRSAGGSAAS